MRRITLTSVLCLAALAPVVYAEDVVFSGPQVGESLPAMTLQGVFDEVEGKQFEFPSTINSEEVADNAAAHNAVTIVFFHERTRPAFGLTNATIKYALKRDGMRSVIVFLTDDATETQQWLTRVRKHFPPKSRVAISTEGKDGPGAFGLNRNVELTVLVAKQGKVTANFALVQPSLQADGPKILQAITDATGGGETPDIATLMGNGRMQARRGGRGAPRPADDAKLTGLLRDFINVDTEDQVVDVAGEIEEYVAANAEARKRLGEIASRVANSDRLENYGIVAAQAQIQVWAKKYGHAQPADSEPTQP